MMNDRDGRRAREVRLVAVVGRAMALVTGACTLGACGSDSAVKPAEIAIVPAAVAPPVAAPTRPTITFSPATITNTASSTLTWTTTGATACTGSGAWSGNQPTFGSITVLGTAAGNATYTLSCTGVGGNSTGSVTLPIPAPASTAEAGGANWLPPYGLYVGNPNGNDAAAMGRFQADWDASVRQLQRQPQFFGTFTDFSQDWSQWSSNASWFAWSFNKSGRVSQMKPVIGIKLSTNAYWNRQNDAFREIISGKRDEVYRKVVAEWRDKGFTELRFRISYEFNGNFMPDNFGNNAETLDLWKKAFAHVADIMHAVPGVKVLVVWNPASINWSGNSVPGAYPGDEYVDVIASDLYSSVYPLSLKNWGGTGDAANLTEWIKRAANRIQFWDYPGSTQWTPVGNGWGLKQALDFAKAHDKPFALGETGVGGDNVKTGPSDDPEFPNYLRARLSEYVAAGGTVDHVILWDYNANDGKWRFTGVPGKEATAAAWTSFVTTSKPL